MEILIAYILLFLGAMASGASILVIKNINHKTLKLITVFGGAFLFAVCFVNLIPEVFHESLHQHGEPSLLLFPIGASILVGFLLQLFLEQLSKGMEHGHIHSNGATISKMSSIMLLVGISIHAFLEGFPIVSDGGVNTSMVTGIIIHNIPISIILVGSFIHSGSTKKFSLLMLAIFASMAIIGSQLNQMLSILHPFQNIIIGIVVGILLHVSTTTLFDSDESHKFNLTRFLIIILAFIIVILLPAHTH